MHFPYRLPVVVEPLDGFLQPVTQGMPRVKSEKLLGPAHVKTSTRLTVRLGGIPLNLPGKPNLSRDHTGEITNRHLFTRSQIDGKMSIILFGRQQNAFRRILDIEEFSSRRSISP